jgi:acetate---CoA ligase (ADP-forming)
MLSDETQVQLRRFLPAEASTANPVDMLASATADQYARAVRLVAEDPNVDAVISLFLPPLATRAQDVARAVANAEVARPVLAVFMQPDELPDLSTPAGGRIAGYHTPEPAAIALAHAVHYAEWLAQPVESILDPEGVQRDDASRVLAQVVLDSPGWLPPSDVRQLLQAYRVPVVDQRIVGTPDETGAVAEELGGAVALKVIAPGVVHKTEAGGVRLNLNGADATREAAQGMAKSARAATGQNPTGYLVQRMAPAGVEILVGVVNDSQFGPTVACGAGGVLLELLHDVSVRLAPLTRGDAAHGAVATQLSHPPMVIAVRPNATSTHSKTCCCAWARWPWITHR